MGENSAQTVKEIEDVRDRLDGELRELEERLPPAHVAKRVGATLLTGTTGTVTFWVLRRARAKRKAKKAPPPAVSTLVQVVPDRWAKQVAEMVEDGTWRRPAAYAAGAWAVFKLAEVRQLRKMNKLLASRA
jgi:hypothetical protein